METNDGWTTHLESVQQLLHYNATGALLRLSVSMPMRCSTALRESLKGCEKWRWSCALCEWISMSLPRTFYKEAFPARFPAPSSASVLSISPQNAAVSRRCTKTRASLKEGSLLFACLSSPLQPSDLYRHHAARRVMVW